MNVRSGVPGVRSSLVLAKNAQARPRSIDQPAPVCSVHLISSVIIDAWIIGWPLCSVSVCSVLCISLLRPTGCRKHSSGANCLHYPCTTAFYLRRPGPSCRPSLRELMKAKIFRAGWRMAMDMCEERLHSSIAESSRVSYGYCLFPPRLSILRWYKVGGYGVWRPDLRHRLRRRARGSPCSIFLSLILFYEQRRTMPEKQRRCLRDSNSSGETPCT